MSARWSKANLWDVLPFELKQAVFNKSDILTQFLNRWLTDEEIQSNSTAIWIEVFSQDWTGDLAIRPQSGFPTAFTGLSRARSQSMYQRLIILRPDFSIENSTMRQRMMIWLIDNTRYGSFNGRGDAVTYVDETDKVESGGESVLTSGRSASGKDTKDIAVESLSGGLIHIAMRNCWINILKPWIAINPTNMAIMAIIFDHFELLKYLVDESSAVNILNLPWDLLRVGPGEICYYVAVIGNGNLEMFKYLRDHGCPIAPSEYHTVVEEAIRL
ncbi:hypothetical protein HDU76_006723, partial [Blyttiomyces sp. JEL0837]